MTCDSTLTIWFPNATKIPTYLPESVMQVDETHLDYRCTRKVGHDGDHGWAQGFDTGWTYRWRATTLRREEDEDGGIGYHPHDDWGD